MILVFIGGTDRTLNVTRNSLKITDELQERTNSCNFQLHNGTRPSEHDEVLVYDAVTIVTVGSNFVIVDDLNAFRTVFRVNDEVWVGINTSDEAKYTVSAIDTTTNKITFSSNLSGISVSEYIGHRIFGGNIYNIQDKNLHLVSHLVFDISCIDFTKQFDNSIVIDTHEDRTARYIINDMLNTFVNYNLLVDQLDYANNAAIQAVWIESGVGNNPTTDASSPYEEDHWGSFASSGSGTATWTATITTQDINEFTGVISGTPIEGILGFWIKHTDYTKITNYTFRIGSDSSNYIEITKTPAQLSIAANTPIFIEIELIDFSVIGTPNWSAMDYAMIQFICTASTTVEFVGIRILQNKHFKHYPHVKDGLTFDAFRINYLKPMSIIQRLAQDSSYFWYIDYERNIHFFDQPTNIAPFNIDAQGITDNFNDLNIDIDITNIKNVQYIEGGEDVSVSTFSQTFESDGVQREWFTQHKFSNLVVEVDSGAGFVVKTIGIEGLVDETTVNYVYNSNGRRVRAGSATATLISGNKIKFTYNERYTIITAAQNGTSITAVKNTLGYGNGQIAGKIIRNTSLKTQQEAKDIAAAEVDRYGNAIISAEFETHIFGLQSGQQIRIIDSTSGRNIDQDFMIQKVNINTSGNNDIVFKILASSVLYGLVEFFQQLLKASTDLQFDETAVPINLIQNVETVIVSDVFALTSQITEIETVIIADAIATTITTPPWQYGAGGSPQARYNLSTYS